MVGKQQKCLAKKQLSYFVVKQLRKSMKPSILQCTRANGKVNCNILQKRVKKSLSLAVGHCCETIQDSQNPSSLSTPISLRKNNSKLSFIGYNAWKVLAPWQMVLPMI